MTNNLVAIYCRLSEEDKNKLSESDDSNSIQNQKSMLIQYAMEHKWSIYNIYSDDDYTGSDRSRPAFNQMLKDAREHKFNIILCKTQSRFTRELELVEKYIHGLFIEWGIRFVSIVDNADTANKGNKKSRQINGLVNEWYLEDMSENIKSVLTDRRKNGFHIGSFALYGYKKDPHQKGHLIIDEEAASVVREVFTLFSQGYGKTAIAKRLNERGVPNPTEYKRLHGLRYKQPHDKNSTLWKYSSIADMLINEIYIGNMVQGKYGSVSYKTKKNTPRPKEEWYIVEGTHEPIIDRPLWNHVQKLISQKTKSFTIGKIGLFTGKARCMYCGYHLRSSKTSDGRHYLKCPTKYVSGDACQGSFISATRLEEAVISEINRLTQEYLDKDEMERTVVFHPNLNEQKESLQKQLAALQDRLKESEKVTRQLYLDKVKGIITEEDFLILSKDFSIERKRWESQIKDVQKQLKIIHEKSKSDFDRRKLIEQYINIEHLDRETVDMLIDHINVGKRIPGTRNVPIEIYWNF